RGRVRDEAREPARRARLHLERGHPGRRAEARRVRARQRPRRAAAARSRRARRDPRRREGRARRHGDVGRAVRGGRREARAAAGRRRGELRMTWPSTEKLQRIKLALEVLLLLLLVPLMLYTLAKDRATAAKIGL